MSRLRLEVEAASGNAQARTVLALRSQSNRVLSTMLGRLTLRSTATSEDVGVDNVLWSAQRRRIISGSDLLGRLLRGIAQQQQP